MSVTFGGFSGFSAVPGEKHGLRDFYERTERRGIDGVQFRRLGSRGRPFDVSIVRFMPAADTDHTGIAALKNTVISFTDNHGAAFTNFRVNDVRILDSEYLASIVYGAFAGGPGYKQRIILTVEKVA